MARRDRYESRIICPKCGRVGSASWEEYENPYHSGRLDSTQGRVSNGFRIQPRGYNFLH